MRACEPSRIARVLVAVGGCLLAACGADTQLSSGVGPSLELGTGTERFEPIVPGEMLRLYAGTQGGHHVWLSYRVTGFDPIEVHMELDVTPAPPARPAHTDVMLDLTAVADKEDTFEYLGWTAQVLDPECAAPGPVDLDLTITDSQGRMEQSSIQVEALPPEEGFRRPCRR